MTTPREPIEELAAADPARHATTYPDVNAMVSRATSSPRKSSAPTSFRVRIAAAALGAGALTTAGIAALTTAATRLPVLALSETSSTTVNASDANMPSGKISSGSLRPYFTSSYTFQSNDLPALAATASVWSLHSFVDSGTVARLAAVFGLHSQPVVTPDPDGTGATYEVVDNDRGSLTVTFTDSSALANWYFSTSSGAVATSSASGPASDRPVAMYHAWGQRVISSLRDGWTYGSPEIYSYDEVDQMRAGASVNYRIELEGRPTDLGLYLSFDSTGSLLSASGQLGEARRVGVYPLVGTGTGVEVLQQQNDDAVRAVSGTQVRGAGDTAPPASGGDLTTNESSNLQTFDVRLTSVAIELWSAQVNGGHYLLPTYIYGGMVHDPADAEVGWNNTWPLIAVSEEYIKVDHTDPSPIAVSTSR